MIAMAKIMGVINVSPESRLIPCDTLDVAVARGIKLASEGADILDIGGESTRPYTPPVNATVELERVIPVIRALKKATSVPLSIDTKKAEVAEAALAEGVAYINDVSGFTDPRMRQLAARSGAKLFIVHMQGTPETMQDNPCYPEGVVPQLKSFFDRQINLLLAEGATADQIILDPGIGFGKTVAHNLQIMKNLADFKKSGFPVLVGVARKSFIARILQKNGEELLPASLALTAAALLNGVDFLRVHDVAETVDVVNIMKAYRDA